MSYYPYSEKSNAYLPATEVSVRNARYHDSFLITQDDALLHAQKNSADNGLPAIAVSPAEGKFLQLLARSIGAKRILEIGTLGGYVFLIR